MELISYGLGDKFEKEKFIPIRNADFLKPKGGLWASPVDSEYGWCDWCKEEDFGNLETNFQFEFDGNILVIDSLPDLKEILWLDYKSYFPLPDFETILAIGYDGIFLTEKGQRDTRFSKPSLYEWDCECVLIMNCNKINLKRGL